MSRLFPEYGEMIRKPIEREARYGDFVTMEDISQNHCGKIVDHGLM